MTHQRPRFDEQSKPANRRPGILPGRRFALALALSGALLGCSTAEAAADPNSGQQVTAVIYPKTGGITTESVTLGALAQNCRPAYTGQPIARYRQDGTQAPSGSVTATTWSVATVLGCLPTPVLIPDAIKILVVQGSAPETGPNSPLLPGDLTYPNPSDFLNPLETPLITSDGNNITYDRPRRSLSDPNADDSVVAPNGTDFVFEVVERTLLSATVTPSANPVAVGGAVSFTAQAPGLAPGSLQYSWDFGGAAPSQSGPSPSVTYYSAGTYDVTVQVTDSAGHVAQSQPLLVQVGSAPPSSTNPSAPPTGPTQSNGGMPGGAPGTSKQPGTVGQRPSGKKPDAGKGKGKPKSATTPGSGGASTGSGHTGSGSSSAPSTAASRRGKPGRAQPAGGHAVTPAKRRSTASTTGPATTVTGRLISDVTLLPVGASPLVHAVAGPLAIAPAARRPLTASLLPALAAALVVFLLFSLGAGRELSWRRPWRVLRVGA